MAVAVTLDNLTKFFGDVRAVDDISLVIEPGELFFLLGPSGCGKTTLLRCIAGFYEPEKGTIKIGEKDVTKLPPHERDTGMVFQSYALWPHMTVSENVAFGLEMRDVPADERKQRVADALEMVRMSDRAQYKPNQLSGGQQQRVALARALVIHPQCLLLDEPLSNLDAKLRLEMRTEIRRICKEAGLTAIYVTHDQKEALSIADRMAVLEGGVIQQLGTPRDVYERPKNSFVANFIGETNFIDGELLEKSEDSFRVKTAIGELLGSTKLGDEISKGDKVKVSLRPEVIRLNRPPEGAKNLFAGEVGNTIYLGELAQHKVKMNKGDDELSLQVFELNPKIVARDTVETAKVWVDPADVVVLKD